MSTLIKGISIPGRLKEIESQIDMHRNSINALEGLARHLKAAPPNCCMFLDTYDPDEHDEGWVQPSCTDDNDDLIWSEYAKHYKFCPYCGKRIHRISDEVSL